MNQEPRAAALCEVSYVDLAASQGMSTQDFFNKATFSMLKVVGWAMEMEVNGIHCLKVCYIHDEDGEENSEGIVIPIANVLSCKVLQDSGEDLLSRPEKN